MKKRGNPMTTAHTDVRISVADFGPIESGTVDLRPLTVFVGPSNTGKTYFAILIYALHRIMEGFPRLPWLPGRRHYHLWWDLQSSEAVGLDTNVWKEELLSVFEKLVTAGRTFRLSDLPDGVNSVMKASLEDPNVLGTGIETELRRCFDVESVFDLVRVSASHPSEDASGMKISLEVGEKNASLWRFRMGISETEISTGGEIEDMVILPEGWSSSELEIRPLFNRFRRLIKEATGKDLLRSQWYLAEDFIEEILESLSLADRSNSGQIETYYLPAARSGIMQSHRVIASSLVLRSTRAGVEAIPELPTFSGVMADFIRYLILHREERATGRPMGVLADALEREGLGGQIRISRPPSGGYPEFMYRPWGTIQDIRLNRASSMVSELAPIVLFLRGRIDPGDTVIIEEPEAHLHPAAQTWMAVTLARMVRAGVRVVVTTHSDWLLKEIGNLMREGELGEIAGECTESDSIPSPLRPSDVGIWLFHQDGTSAGSQVREIPFDRSEGVEPRDYEDVAEELYNRSAILQNRFEEAAVSDNE